MKKLGTVIRYECETSFKYIWIFYACVFAVIAIIYAIACAVTGGFDQVGTNALEVNSMVYVGILGVMGYKEDFKMLLQNGFTRKYIFLSTLSLFAFVSAVMAFVDTILGNVLHIFSSRYDSFFAGVYGYGHSILLNWLLLFLVYMSLCCLLYFIVLIINKIGKMTTLIFGISLGFLFIVLVPVLFRFALPEETQNAVLEFLLKTAGFMADGTINLFYPILLFLVLGGIFGYCGYVVLRKTELKV